MRDYAELVKALRTCKLSIPCTECPFYSNGDEPSKECATMNVAAADAIEKLESYCKELESKVPHWISVEERLPDEWREVLTYSPIHSDEKNPHMIQLCWYIGNGKWRECQYGEIMEIPIIHWMPVPAPPKEVQDG